MAMPPSQYQISRSVATTIGRRIAELMAETGLTQGDLVKNEGLSYNTIQGWLDGTHAPSLAVLLHLVDVFELCSVEEILGGPLGTRSCRRERRHRSRPD